jgi:hypothetical protein
MKPCSLAVRLFALPALAVTSLLGFGSAARADIIFQNNTDFHLGGNIINYVPFRDDGTPNRPFGSRLGETVTFAGAARSLDSVELGVFNRTGANLTYTLDIYAGANPNTGALLGSASVPLGPASGVLMPTFDFGGLPVPDTVTFVVSSDDTSGGFPMTGPLSSNIAPTVGSGPNSLWFGNGPGTFTANNTWAIDDGALTNFLVVQFDATGVPEPATLTLFGTGLAGLVAVGWRRRGVKRTSGEGAKWHFPATRSGPQAVSDTPRHRHRAGNGAAGACRETRPPAVTML